MTTTTEAIARSISHTEIVTIVATDTKEYERITTDLLVACEDSAESNGVDEFWGTADGSEWRVHVTKPQSDDAGLTYTIRVNPIRTQCDSLVDVLGGFPGYVAEIHDSRRQLVRVTDSIATARGAASCARRILARLRGDEAAEAAEVVTDVDALDAEIVEVAS